MKDSWIKNTFVVTKDSFPTVHRCSPVIERIEIELSPIEASIKVVRDKNEEVSQMIEKTEITGQWKSSLTMCLKGRIHPVFAEFRCY